MGPSENMIKLKKLIILPFLLVFSVYGNTNYLYKNVKLQAGQLTLKAALKSLSDQSGCIFSYNPVSVQVSQVITIPSNYANTLNLTLKKILPGDISFTANGKYIVLQKQDIDKKQNNQDAKQAGFQKQKNTPKVDSKIDSDPKKVRLVLPPMTATDDYLSAKQPIESKDSNVLIYPDLNVDKLALKTDSLSVDKANQKSYSLTNYVDLKLEAAEIRKLKTISFVKRKAIFDLELASNTPLSSLSVNAGLYGLYGIFSLATDYNNSYRMGYGCGFKKIIKDNFGINLNIIQHTLFAGKSYNLGVRATLTHFDPMVSYSVGKGFSFLVGPSLYYAESRFENPDTVTDLGNYYGLGIMFGVKFDVVNQLFNSR